MSGYGSAVCRQRDCIRTHAWCGCGVRVMPELMQSVSDSVSFAGAIILCPQLCTVHHVHVAPALQTTVLEYELIE
jgi:hypothetical protein